MTGQIDDTGLAEAITRYLDANWQGVTDPTLLSLVRIHGGASRETYAIDVQFTENGARTEKGLILRRDPAGSLIDTDRKIEFAAIQSMAGTDLPVPQALFLETGDAALGAPFFIMERIDGGEALNPFRIEDVEPHRTEIGRQFFRHLGTIARVPAEGSPLAAVTDIPDPALCWRRELDYWATEIRSKAQRAEPIAEAAIRYLKANPPPPAQRLSIVHGDYRSGNFLHDGAGKINALLDWEMAHIGDPYEDLAWATDPLWCNNDTERAAGYLPWPDALAAWQAASGCQFDPAAFEWWSIFSHVKAIGIWISSAHAFIQGDNDDPILAWSGWFTHAAHELTIASRLAPKFGLDLPSEETPKEPAPLSGTGLILDRIGRKLVTEVTPQLEGHYAGGHTAVSGLMAVMAGEAWDSAADRRHREIEAMRAVLESAGEPASETAPSLKLSDLDVLRNQFAERLSSLQARVENSGDPGDKALNMRIWILLLMGAAERMPSHPDFPAPEDEPH
ncbi:MAG: phosphotransferase family protein [Pseudomonadota bacterium]